MISALCVHVHECMLVCVHTCDECMCVHMYI